jgi:pantoate--beta-alanine ligase
LSLQRYSAVAPAAERCAQLRAAGKTLGFVPTMGALHEGHLGLVRRSVAACDATVVSVFVNPLQFDESSDLEGYPRDFEGDAQLLEEAGCDVVFTGTLPEFFPEELNEEGALNPGSLKDPGPSALGLEGDSRAGHFAGMATIVDRLFEVVSPTHAYFGRKDYQQALIVQELAQRRGEPIVEVCPTCREKDGLARSSRNKSLLEGERRDALVLSRALAACDGAWRDGERDAETLRQILSAPLEEMSGVRLDYAALREREAWSAEHPVGDLAAGVALIAARVGAVRLIDNLILGEGDSCEIARVKGALL